MSNFPSLNEQMDIIRSGVEEIVPEAELVKKIEKSIANKEPLTRPSELIEISPLSKGNNLPIKE